ncbi:MAG: aldehyde dehydrogenase family protein [Serratia symbiotica]|nr:aldehyde dehydrogenase family protein [Serratia symbiotica]
MKTMGNFIGGQVCLSSSNQTVEVHNTATRQVERRVTQSTATEVKQDIDVAHQTFADWSRATPLRRARIMFNFKALLEQQRDELATLIVSEHGKVYSDALCE